MPFDEDPATTTTPQPTVSKYRQIGEFTGEIQQIADDGTLLGILRYRIEKREDDVVLSWDSVYENEGGEIALSTAAKDQLRDMQRGILRAIGKIPSP